MSKLKRLMPGPRIKCSVPFCNRTTGDKGEFHQWICHQHWRQISPNKRRVYSLAKRRLKRVRIARTVVDRFWERLKIIAIEKAAGIL